MPIPFSVRRIDHVVLRAVDPAKLGAFYTKVMGCPVEKRQDHIGLIQLRAGDALIDIIPAGDADTGQRPSASGNMDHLCLRIMPFDTAARVAD